jgi:hypothetical protein
VIFLMPERGSGFVVLANASGFEQQSQVDGIAKGILSLLNGKPAAPVSLPFLLRFLYWLLLLTPVLQILGIVLVWRKRQRIKGWLVTLIVIVNLAVVFLLYRLSLQIITLPSMLVYYPELGYTLVAVAALGIGWSVIYTATNFIARRAQ